MNETPLVSIVVPMYNVKQFLMECMESIAEQTYTNFEAIFIDNCSTDGGYEMAVAFAEKDPRFTIYRNEKNMGYTYSMNRGLGLAQGKYVCLMDSDDIMMPNRIELQVDFLENHPDIFLVAGGWIKINEDSEVIGENEPATVPTENVNEILLESNVIHNPTAMFRNEGGWEYRGKPGAVMVYDFLLRMISAGKQLTNIPDKLIKYRWRSTSLTHSKAAHQVLLQKVSREFYWERERTGTDSFETYDFDALLEKSIYEIDDREAVEFEIYARSRTADPRELRKPTLYFLRKFKTPRPRILAIAIDSFLGRRVVGSMLDIIKKQCLGVLEKPHRS